jgi:hypothetical protein
VRLAFALYGQVAGLIERDVDLTASGDQDERWGA